MAVGGVASLMVTKGPHVGVSPLDQPLVNFSNVSNSGTNHREHSNGDLELSSAGSAHRNNRYVLIKTAQSDFTVWKFHDFAITQILREINFEDSRSAKTAVFAILGAIFSLQKMPKFLKIKTQSL